MELERLIAAAESSASDLHRIQEALGEMGALREAADHGDREAAQRLEKMCADAKQAAEEFDTSFRECREAAERGDMLSRRKLGEMLLTGAPVIMDAVDLETWMARGREWSAKFQERMQQIKEGVGGPPMVETPPALPRSVAPAPIEAAKWFRLAAEQGDTPSQRYLGEMYEQGKGVAQDPEAAAKWFRMAADAGDAKGCVQYALSELVACLGTPRETEVVERLRKAAEAGDVWGQYTLGIYYEDKRDNPELRALALPWFRLAAAKNHPESLFHLAEYYRWGEVIPRDDDEAVRLYRQAYAADAAVFRNLGFPSTWVGSPEDKAEDLAWFGKQAALGEPWAKDIYADLVPKPEPLIDLELDEEPLTGEPPERQ